MHRLPYDVQLAVLRLLAVRDIVRLCATCRALQELMADRSIWHHALARLLRRFPQPLLVRRLPHMPGDELRTRVLNSARLDRLWHAVDYRPRLVTDFHCGGAVEHVNLVAGGTWLVVVLYDGSLQLHELGAAHPAVTLAPTLTEDESVFYLSSRLSLTNDHEDLIILQMGVRYNQCNIYVYHIAVTDPAPAFVLIGKVSVTGSVWCCASGSDILVYGLESGGGDMVLHVCHIGPTATPSLQPEISLNIGPWSADEDFTISVLSERLLLLAHHGGLDLYAIPPHTPHVLEDAPAQGSGGNSSPSSSAIRVQPLWSRAADVGSGIYRISPFSQGQGRSSASSTRPSPHPLVVAGTHALHVLRVVPVPSAVPGVDTERIEYREVAYPRGGHGGGEGGGGAMAHMGLGAVGLRRAIWDCTEARNGSAYVRFQTYSLPRAVLEDGPNTEDAASSRLDGEHEDELGMRGRLGSFTVSLDPAEHLVSLCLEESTGRVCLLLNNVNTGARRVSIIDAV